jgi:hypothetical protein
MAKRYGILNRRQALILEASIQNTNSSKPKDTRSRSYKQMPEPKLYKQKPRSKTTVPWEDTDFKIASKEVHSHGQNSKIPSLQKTDATLIKQMRTQPSSDQENTTPIKQETRPSTT